MLIGIRKTIRTILQFVLLTIFRTPDDFDFPSKTEVSDPFLGDDSPPDSFTLVLWNDESHSFSEVTEILVDALQISSEEGGRFASIVDQLV